jgi:hypothetical protein
MSDPSHEESEDERTRRLERQRVGPEEEVRKSPEQAESRMEEDQEPPPGPGRAGTERPAGRH